MNEQELKHAALGEAFVEAYSDELFHHGIKGMKWGIRRFQNKDGSLTNAGRKRYGEQFGEAMSKGYNATKKAVSKGYEKTKTAVANRQAKKAAAKAEKIAKQRAQITSSRKLTDEELRSRIARLELEQNYQKLLKDTSSISKGQTFAMSVLESSGKNLLTQVANHYGAKALNRIIGSEVIYANNKKK